MTFNRVQLLRNKPIKVLRENEKDFIYVQGPTIAELYDNELYFFVVQLLVLPREDLIKLLESKNDKYSKIEMINIVLTESDQKEIFKEYMSKIIIGSKMKGHFLSHNGQEITEKEIEMISDLISIIMGQKKYEEYSEEQKELTDEEKRLAELEKRIQEKKKRKVESEQKEEPKNILEDIMIALTYEFGFTIEHMMQMNYFTILWYYSYTGKLHVYRFNQFALSSGAVKKINTDYFTSLK
jgi:hypothetical protein